MVATAPLYAETITTTLDLSKLGDGKNSVHYFDSGGVLYGYLKGTEFTKFEMSTLIRQTVPLKPIGEPRTVDHAPKGMIDQLCTRSTESCWQSAPLQLTVCTSRCIERRDAEGGEAKPVSDERNVQLTIVTAATAKPK